MNTRLLALALAVSSSAAAAPDSPTSLQAPTPLQTLSQAVTAGEGGFHVRYRYEHVDQDGLDETADASTSRARFTWSSAAIGEWLFGFEADYVAVIGAERFNSTVNDKAAYPVVADPDGFDLNQAWVRYRTDDLTVTGGRQRILHGAQRFVGGVGWRQNEQTFDAVRAEGVIGSGVAVDYSYVANVNRVFGPQNGTQPANWRGHTHLLYVGLPLGDRLQAGAFGYLMDFTNANGPANANATFGVDLAATLGALELEASLARQTDHGDSPLNYRADYARLQGAVPMFDAAAKVVLGYEVLGSDGGDAAFRTPLATLHAFQGWADLFLNTPADGIRDGYAGVSANRGAYSAAVYYHHFSADENRRRYGTELNLALGYALTPKANVQLKLANYRSEHFGADTRKAWLTFNLAL
jgi:hypothetical protein